MLRTIPAKLIAGLIRVLAICFKLPQVPERFLLFGLYSRDALGQVQLVGLQTDRERLGVGSLGSRGGLCRSIVPSEHGCRPLHRSLHRTAGGIDNHALIDRPVASYRFIHFALWKTLRRQARRSVIAEYVEGQGRACVMGIFAHRA